MDSIACADRQCGVVAADAAVVVAALAPPRQFLTKVARGAPVKLLASACLLHAFRDMGLTGFALAPLGVAVVGLGGASIAKAEAQQSRATAASAAVIFILGLQFERVRLHVAAGGHVRRGLLSPS